ncbi:MAG: hypothetical protein E6R03_10435 [Hyphomicrobiaceae bacterium]|nr:MAG: hypothetical protein E6R03_10435 [Hyphomicrobiaceae bacterium]
MGFEALFAQLLNAMLMKCLSDISSQTPQEYVRDHFDPATGRIDPELVNDAMPAAARAARKARRSLPPAERKDAPKLSREDLYARTEAQLIEGMHATTEQVFACREFAATLGDD